METQDLARLIASTVIRRQPALTTDAVRALAEAIVGDMQAAHFTIVAPAIAPAGEAHDKSSEDRREPRARVLKSAMIVFNDGNCSMGCQVLDLSDGGARLKPDDLRSCPAAFTLKFKNDMVRECEVRWRNGDTLGVRFR